MVVKTKDKSVRLKQRVEDPVVLNRKDRSLGLERVEDPVAAGLARARKAWKEYQENREYDRNAVYIYLRVVFDVVQQWEKVGLADEYSLMALKRDIPIRMKADPYARVIYCTSSKDDPKVRSKWANVMRWVAKHNKKGRSFTKFVTNNGGLNKCADYASGFDPEWT